MNKPTVLLSAAMLPVTIAAVFYCSSCASGTHDRSAVVTSTPSGSASGDPGVRPYDRRPRDPRIGREKMLVILRSSGAVDTSSPKARLALSAITEVNAAAARLSRDISFSNVECYNAGCAVEFKSSSLTKLLMVNQNLGAKAKELWNGPVVVTGAETKGDIGVSSWLMLFTGDKIGH